MDFKQELLTRIDALAAKLGVTADHIWQILIKQAQAEVWATVLSVIVCAAMSVACLYGCRVSLARYQESHEDGWAIGSIIGGASGIVAAISAIANVFCLPTLLINPEYWALQQVLAAIK